MSAAEGDEDERLGTRTIALAGFMGVGKSSIGKSAATALRRPFFDSDLVVTERLGASIASLFRSGEEGRFRRSEAEVVAELVELSPPPVIALGGGALVDPKTLALLREHSLLVHLHLPWEILERILPRLRRGRPLLEERTDEEVHALFTEREAIYSNCHMTLELHREGVANATAALLEALESFGVTAPPTPLADRPLI